MGGQAVTEAGMGASGLLLRMLPREEAGLPSGQGLPVRGGGLEPQSPGTGVRAGTLSPSVNWGGSCFTLVPFLC